MKKLRYGAMAVAIVVGVGAFLGAQRLDLIPGPWSKKRMAQMYGNRDIEAFSAEIAARPNDYMAYYRRGVMLYRGRLYDRALADFNEAVRLSPIPVSVQDLGERAMDTAYPATHTLNLVVLVRTTRAEVLQIMNRPDEALADLDQAWAFDARKNEILFARARLRAVTGQYDAAIADFDQLLDRRRDPAWSFHRGMARYLQGQWDAAIADFQTAAERDPKISAYSVWLAKAYLRAGIPMPPAQFAAPRISDDTRRVIEALMSDHDPAQFISGVRAGAAFANRNAQGSQCETALFLGDWLTLRKKGDGARDMFAEAEASCHPLTIERAVATAELQRLAP